MIYFTSDWHLEHYKIIEYCKRPFVGCKKMEETIVANYINIVKETDEVFFIGDIFWNTNLNYMKSVLDKLHGKKILIKGNHDNASNTKYKKAGFSNVYDTHTTIEQSDCTFCLTHDPSNSQMDRSITFLCGHVHDLFIHQKNVINVGVDVWNFSPVSIMDIIKVLDNKGIYNV